MAVAPDLRATGTRLASAGRATALRLTSRFALAALAVTVASALSIGLLAPAATADSLTAERDRVASQLARTKSELSESSKALSAANAAVEQTAGRLDQARAALVRTQAELAAAHARDVAMAKRLKKAKAQLAAATAKVEAAQKALDAQIAMAGNMVRDQYQQQTNLLPIAVLMENTSTADLQNRLQWSTTMFDTTSATIDDLTVLRKKLAAEKARRAELAAQVEVSRKEAAANLKLKQRLELQAEAQERSVAQLLQQKQDVENAAADDVAKDKAQYAKLTQERASVEQRIAARIAKAKAAAAREQARQAAARRAAAKSAAEAKRARAAAKKPVRRSSSSARSSSPRPSYSRPSSPPPRSSSSAHHGFGYPVSAPITSPYGMRLHPVLRYWKLHDGTDFGAGCGTAIRAPYSGRVAERYYNSAYGNRLMIDHGSVNGRYVTTGYNHAIRYTVSVGQRVSKGQVVGYVGTTGYSTGCHLHLMLWVNGGLSNPMTWF